MSLEEKVNNHGGKGGGLFKTIGRIGLALHGLFHVAVAVAATYAGAVATGLAHIEESYSYLFTGMNICLAAWGLYYGYQGIKEYFTHRKHGHKEYHAAYAH